MKKAEFLSLLRESLEGNITRADVEENIKYYSRYFDESEKSEEEVCEELGDPRLIARTVIDARIASKGPMAEHYRSQARSEAQGEQGYSGSGYKDNLEDEYVQMTWKDKLTYVLIVLGIIVALIIIAKVAISVFFKIVLPLIVIFLIIALVAKLINGSGGNGL